MLLYGDRINVLQSQIILILIVLFRQIGASPSEHPKINKRNITSWYAENGWLQLLSPQARKYHQLECETGKRLESIAREEQIKSRELLISRQMENKKEEVDLDTCSTGKESELSSTEKIYTLPEEFDSFFVKHSQKQPLFEDADWPELQDSVLDWFKKKGVLQGQPENIKVQVLCTSKRKTQNNRLIESFGQRFNNKLTVSI